MTTVIATINLKGGVGKTTTTVAVAEMLAGQFGKKVLLIDLDPQTNASVMMIGEKRWKELNDQGSTLARLFKDALEEPTDRKFDLERTLQKSASDVEEVRSLDLLPSSLDLIDVQDRLASMPSGRFFADNPVDLLRRGIRPLLNDDVYDYVLIDCPPNLGIITLNGLRISQFYIIPTIPDILSTYGIPQIISRVGDFSRNIGEEIRPLGIVISKYRAQAPLHRSMTERLASGKDAPVFTTKIPETNQIAQAAEFTSRGTLRQKWGYQGQFDAYYGLTSELLQRIAP